MAVYSIKGQSHRHALSVEGDRRGELGMVLNSQNEWECPKCHAISCDDWSHCIGTCPISSSPHHKGQVVKDELEDYGELFNADPECEHKIVGAPGGGIKCVKCRGWFCY